MTSPMREGASYRISSILIIVFLARFLPTTAQQSSTISEPTFGVEISVPDGWVYQRTDAGYVLGHNSIPGIILITTSPYNTLQELEQAAYQGIQEEGVSLQLVGSPQPFGTNGLAGEYQGTMNWEAVKAYAIALLHAYGGKTISFMVITTQQMYSEKHKRVVEQLAESLKFTKPEIPDVVKEWENWFKSPGGCRLKYMSSSGTSTYDGGYTGSSSEATIDLCPNGSFSYNSSSDFSMSIDAGNAYSASNDDGLGSWTLSFNGTNPVLELKFNNGEYSEYELTYVDQKTYLNGTRYFVLFDKEGPGCY